jgi:hypothetical protein
MWQKRLCEYLASKGRYDAAERLFRRSLRTMARLSRRTSDKRACEIAGVILANERCIRARTQERRAAAKLKVALRGATTVTRLMAKGGALCADLPQAANR